MLAKIKGTTVVKYPYLWEDLQNDNPYTLFDVTQSIETCFEGTESNLDGNVLVEVEEAEIPIYDEPNENLVLNEVPTLVNGKWVLEHSVVEKSQLEKTQYLNVKRDEALHARDGLLRKSDWTHITDYIVKPLSAEKKLEWAQYRQQLRDIESSPGFPLNVVFPELPSE